MPAERFNDGNQGKARKGQGIIARLLGTTAKENKTKNSRIPRGGEGGNAAKKSKKR